MNPLRTGFLRRCRKAGHGLWLLALLFVGLACFAPSAAKAQISGAIFTTDTLGAVDRNIYYDKMDVYLNGGPAHPGAAGLPDSTTAGVADYYVKVTEPDGTLLGKSVIPVVEVAGGEFADLYQLSAILKTFSSGFIDPGYDTTTNPGGEYKVWVSKDPNFDPSQSKTDNFKVKILDEQIPPPEDAELCVEKFYDVNVNGTFEEGTDIPITGWMVFITGDANLVRFTPSCTIVEPGTYNVTEAEPLENHWIHTTGTTVTGLVLEPGDHVTVSFGNVCIGAGGGKTLGFWSNKNGQAIFTNGTDLAMIVSLNLRTASGANFDPANYAAFRTWILSANATNMAYMLSAQLAAMELNVFNGLVSGSALVYAPQLLPFSTTGLNALGFISINDLMTAANTELGLHGSVLAGSPFRTYQEALKNALDQGNNNLNFVQATPCPFSFAPLE